MESGPAARTFDVLASEDLARSTSLASVAPLPKTVYIDCSTWRSCASRCSRPRALESNRVSLKVLVVLRRWVSTRGVAHPPQLIFSRQTVAPYVEGSFRDTPPRSYSLQGVLLQPPCGAAPRFTFSCVDESWSSVRLLSADPCITQ